MEFFKNIIKSAYSPDYYNELSQKPFSYSFKYFAVFALLVALIMGSAMTVVFVPKLNNFLDKILSNTFSAFPQGFEVNIKNGQASANVQQPYFIKMPEAVKLIDDPELNLAKKTENMIVIDTENKFDLEKYSSYKTLSVLNKDTFSFIDKNGSVSVNSLKDSPDFTINKEQVLSNIEQIKPFFKFLYPFGFIALFIFSLFVVFSTLIYMFFGALFVMLAGIIKGVKIKYWKAYQLGLHLITAVIVLEAISFVVGFNDPVPFFWTLVLFIFAVINLKKYDVQTQ